jgi:hypothetical protein
VKGYSYNYSLASRASFFNHGICDPFCQLAFLFGCAALQHRDLN